MKTKHTVGVSGHREATEVCRMLETYIPWKMRWQRAGDWRVVAELRGGQRKNLCHQKASRVGN